MEVRGSVKVTKDGFVLRNYKTTHDQCVDKFLKDKESVVVSITFEDDEPYKTSNQLAYLFGEVGVKALTGYKAWGRNLQTKERAVDMLMNDLGYVDTIKDDNGNTLATWPRHISSGRVKWVSEFIQDAIVFIQVEMGIEVTTPEEYFKGKTIKGA